MALILSGGDGGNATITGNSGNLTIANATAILASSATISASGDVTGGNLITTGRVSATGNIQGSFILGNGSQLTGVTAGLTTGKSLAITLIMGG